MRNRVNLLGVWVDSIDLAGVGARITDLVLDGRPHQIVPANVDFLRHASEDTSFREIVNAADLVVPDGMPLVWAARRLGHQMPQRISGVELILTCAQTAAQRGFSIFLLGAASGVADEVATVLQARFPDLRVAGTLSPPPLPLSPFEEERVVRQIQEMQPDILLVAFGVPLQECWIQAHLDHLRVPICVGVGGAFDMLAGRVRRAPLWMQRHGLEWFYRLVQEPRRLWKRYIVHDLPVFMRLMTQPRQMTAPPLTTVRLIEEVLPDLTLLEESRTRVG